MMMLKTIKMMIAGMMVVGVQAQQGVLKESYKEDFHLLCDVMKSTTGLWSTATYDEDFTENMGPTSKTIDEIFFGSRWSGSNGGGLDLPLGFTDANFRRSKVCGYHEDAEVLPSASNSLAYSIFCLCASVNKDENDLCGLNADGIGTWTDDEKQNVKDVFEKIWYGKENNGGVMKRCGNPGSDEGVEKEKKRFEDSLAKVEDTLKVKNGTLGKNETPCDTPSPCANVTQTPAWLTKLKEIKDITKDIKEPLKSAPPTKKEIHNNNPTPHKPAPTQAPAPEHVGPQGTVETPKQEARKAHQEEPKPQPKAEPGKLLEDIPQKPAETTGNHLPISENETNGTFLNIQRWFLLAALLI